MQSWKGKRLLAVATACMGRDGVPTFAYTEVEVTLEEYRNGAHLDLVEQRLADGRCDEPYVHFDDIDAPPFLIGAVRAHLGLHTDQRPKATHCRQR